MIVRHGGSSFDQKLQAWNPKSVSDVREAVVLLAQLKKSIAERVAKIEGAIQHDRCPAGAGMPPEQCAQCQDEARYTHLAGLEHLHDFEQDKVKRLDRFLERVPAAVRDRV